VRPAAVLINLEALDQMVVGPQWIVAIIERDIGGEATRRNHRGCGEVFSHP
jgi:hypothetical protein